MSWRVLPLLPSSWWCAGCWLLGGPTQTGHGRAPRSLVSTTRWGEYYFMYPFLIYPGEESSLTLSFSVAYKLSGSRRVSTHTHIDRGTQRGRVDTSHCRKETKTKGLLLICKLYLQSFIAMNKSEKTCKCRVRICVWQNLSFVFWNINLWKLNILL